jgi:hypothetical protein
MKFFLPQLQIATLQPPQSRFRSKFGGLPWGLPVEKWSRCQQCHARMSLLAQLSHDPPALDLGDPEYVLHLFQCQNCFGYDAGEGNDAEMVRASELGRGLTPLPQGENLSGILATNLDQMVGELWIEGWTEQDDGFDPALAKELFDQDRWIQLPESDRHRMFESRWRTKMGGIPYWTGNGPLQRPRAGYEFLFQMDSAIPLRGAVPTPDEVGGMVTVTELAGEGMEVRIARQDYHKPQPGKGKVNAPWNVEVDAATPGEYFVEITNFGTDGTAYVFINRNSNPASVYWFWNR